MAYKAQTFIDAIPGTGGVISALADKVGCDWDTAKKYVTEYATVRQAHENECERIADKAENVLIMSINKGSTADAKWYLSRIRRGKFATRTETDITTDGEKITVDEKETNRAISSLADALGEIISGAGKEQDGAMDAAE